MSRNLEDVEKDFSWKTSDWSPKVMQTISRGSRRLSSSQALASEVRGVPCF